MELHLTKRRLLWIGDACVSSGFARATHKILETVSQSFDVHVLGLNYMGDPHPYPYPVYPGFTGGDALGYGRVKSLVQKIGPSVVIVQNDPWNFQEYIRRIGNVPTIGIVAIDGKNCQGKLLNGLTLAIFWTKYGRDQADLGGYTGPSVVIPLGVDQEMYHPFDAKEMRAGMNLPQVLGNRGLPPDTFIVGVVGRNQPRKRLDLTLQYFSDWIHTCKIPDAALWLHVAPTQEAGFDLGQLGEYYRISDRVFQPSINPTIGITEESMARVYSVFDVLVNTCVGEGWGLPIQEAMACGVPCIVPDWAALGEWPEDAVFKVPCTATAVAPGINTVGGVADRQTFMQALDAFYGSKDVRRVYSQRGLSLVSRPEFRWASVGQAFTEAIERTLYQPVGGEISLGDPLWA